MNDVDFCIEYVKRMCELHSQLDTKTSIQLRRIVIRQEPVDIKDMFSENAVKHLFHKQYVSQFVYNFVRDNQSLFIGH